MAKSLQWAFSADAGNANRLVTAILAETDKHLERMHIVACNVVMSRMVHGDVMPMQRLIQGMHDRKQYVAGLKKWLESQGNVTIGLDDNKSIVVTIGELPLMTKEEALAWAENAPTFWNSSPPPDAFKGFNFDEELAKLVKRTKEMVRAKTQGTIKRKGAIKELTQAEIDTIELGEFNKVMAKLYGVTSKPEAPAKAEKNIITH
jgi:hypothetical protein